MATVKGQNLRIYVGSKAIAAALECQLQLQLNVATYSTKDDEDDWVRNRVASLQWSVTANAAVTDEEELGAIGVAELSDLIGQTVQAQLATASGDKNRDSGETMVAGDAIVSDIQYTAQNRQRTTCQLTLTGKKNALIDIRALMSADEHYLVSANGSKLFAAHEPNE